MLSSRPTAVAGLFYPDDPQELTEAVENYIEQGKDSDLPDVKALITPHAGYIYSGAIAGSAYKALIHRKEPIERVILFGPAHRLGFKGVADSQCVSFRSPLGEISLDRETLDSLVEQRLVKAFAQSHSEEHCLEVQLPFLLKSISNNFKLIPLLVGDETSDKVATLLEQIWMPTDLIVVSSDLSHYLPYEQANERDQQTTESICQLEKNISGFQACGSRPIVGLNIFAAKKGWEVRCLDRRNSGDTAGDKQRVVGYGAYALF
ncbi:MAG: AmmeMemoRadiSam system protein B [Gammaproteobacteria bacterium]|nr:AmmeMemoRadiSam system protein B [Gammaproteobacteria bacterium]